MKRISLFLLVTLLIGGLRPIYAAERPNILFISVDDLNDFPGFTQLYPDAKTPHMDALAQQGMVFTQAHCQYPLCGPSRASVMSGMLPSKLGFETHMKDEELQARVRELGSKLLHSYFAEHGYKTMAVGKILHDHVPEGSVDASGGRGRFIEGTERLRANWPQKGTVTDWAAAPERDDQLPDYDAAEWAVKQLQEEHDKPFMLMVGFLRPHVPWYAPQKWFDLYDRNALTLPPYKADDLDDVPAIARRISILPQMPRTEWAIEENQWSHIIHAYLACTSFVDEQVGKVLKALEESPYKENTIIVLWSDHGYHLGEKNTFQKHSLWERSSHVPLILSGPGVQEGTRCNRVVSLLDLYPTLVEMCGLPANKVNEGRSLVPLLEKPDKPWPYPAITGWMEESFALQDETYRYILYGDGSEELYDHRTDINEWTNLADVKEEKAVKTTMEKTLKHLLKKSSKKSNP